MNGTSITECWKCKQRYSFVKDPSGSTRVTCPQCGSKATVKSKTEQPRMVEQSPTQQRQPRKNTIGIPTNLLTIVLCIGLAVASCCVIIIQASNSDLQNQLTNAKTNLTETKNNLLETSLDLSFTLNNLTAARTQITSLQSSLTTTQNDLAARILQLQAKTNELNAVVLILDDTNYSLNNTNKFIKSFYNATSIYYNGTASELISYQKYNASEIHFNNGNWTTASDSFNETKTYYNTTQQRYQLSADKFNESYYCTNNTLYKNLTSKYRDMMTSSVQQISYLYNATEYMRMASLYFNTSNTTEGNQSVNSSILQRNLYTTELTTYNTYLNESKVILALIENS